MAKTDISEFQKSIKQEFDDSVSISLLGGTFRRNSYTFKVTLKSGKTIVLKLLKKQNGAESKINDEKQSLKHLEGAEGLRVSKLLDSGELRVKSKRFPYLVFPYYEGKVVSELTQNGKKCSENEVKEFVYSVSRTILKLAEFGIIHQDIKPDNIILGKDGDYTLLDLGISRFTTLEASFVKQQGPAAYLSLEQVQLGTNKTISNQRRVTFLSDLNSLGIVALNLLLGSAFAQVWEVDRRQEAAQRIRDGEIVDIDDSELREIIASLLEPTPSTRLLKLNPYIDFSAFKSTESFTNRYWSLHKGTGLSFLKPFANENPELKLGLILSAETVQSIPNTIQVVDALKEQEWEIAVDPSTHKLLFNADHHAHLKKRKYYREDLLLENFFDTGFTQTFVSQVIEFQRLLSPTLYISPYFFVKNNADQRLSVGFNLFDESKNQLKKLGDSKPIAFGLSISKALLLGREQDIDGLVDQIVVNNKIEIVYLNLELIKKDSSPCNDKDYLKGVKRLVQRLATTKQVILSQIDQASLGLLTQETVSLAINPSTSYRKNDIEQKLKDDKEEQTGGPKAVDRRYRVYIPKLMNDLDIARDINNATFKKLDKSLAITNPSGKSPYLDSATDIGDSAARNKHFTYEFNRQINAIASKKVEDSQRNLAAEIKSAKTAYREIAKAGIKLDGDQGGDFLEVWEEVFLES